MIPLDRLADVLAHMTAGPWRCMGSHTVWAADESVAATSRRDAAGIAALRNLAPLLITVARAARTVMAEREGPATACENRLDAELTALDSAIVKALEEGT